MDRGDHRLAPRIVLGLYALLGVFTLVWLALERRHMLMVNYLPYHRAGEAVLAAENLYAVSHPEAPAYHFLYPPITALAWVPATLTQPAVGYLVQTAISLGLGLAIAVVAWRLIEAQGVALAAVDRGLLAIASVASSFTLPTLLYGNVNLILAGCIALGVYALHRGRPVAAGVAFGLPGLVKVFPAAFGLWLLWLRRDRSSIAWMATGLAGLAAGVVVFGRSLTETWIDEALLPRTEPDLFVGGLPEWAGYVSLRQPLALGLGTDGLVVTVLAIVAVAPLVAGSLRRIDRLDGQLLGLLGVVAGTLLVLPTYYVYLVLLVPALLPLAYLIEGRTVRRLYFAGMGLIAVTLTPANLSVVDSLLPGVVLDGLTAAMTVARPPLVGVLLVLVAAALAAGRLSPVDGRRASHL